MESWLAGLLVAVGVLLLLAVLAFVDWVRRERQKIPPEDRRPWAEIRAEARATLPAVLRETARSLRRHLAEDAAVRRRMRENARRAYQDLRQENYDKTREELRREKGLP